MSKVKKQGEPRQCLRFQHPDRMLREVIFWTSAKDAVTDATKKVTVHLSDGTKQVISTDCDVLVINDSGEVVDTIR